MKKTKTTNPVLKKLIRDLRKREENLWKDLALRLSKSNKNRAEVNIAKINRFAENGKIIVVPGKVLGYGKLDEKITVAALSFSKQAKEKIKKANGNYKKIEEILDEKPEKIKIIR